MASVKKQVKKYIKENAPGTKGMTRAEKKEAEAAFAADVKAFKKAAKKQKRKSRFIKVFLLGNLIGGRKTWKAFHSKKSKKYKRQELGRR